MSAGAKHAPRACQDDGSARARSSPRQSRQTPRRATMAQRSEHQHRPASFYASPEEAAMAAPPEMLLYLACLHRGTGVERPDFIAVVDADPDSDRYGEI